MEYKLGISAMHFSSLLASFPRPRQAKICPPPFVILLCLMPDDFTHRGRTSWWEKVTSTHGPLNCNDSGIYI